MLLHPLHLSRALALDTSISNEYFFVHKKLRWLLINRGRVVGIGEDEAVRNRGVFFVIANELDSNGSLEIVRS